MIREIDINKVEEVLEITYTLKGDVYCLFDDINEGITKENRKGILNVISLMKEDVLKVEHILKEICLIDYDSKVTEADILKDDSITIIQILTEFANATSNINDYAILITECMNNSSININESVLTMKKKINLLEQSIREMPLIER